jgi:hypothetical protein
MTFSGRAIERVILPSHRTFELIDTVLGHDPPSKDLRLTRPRVLTYELDKFAPDTAV